jgi:putative sterol carrier protein
MKEITVQEIIEVKFVKKVAEQPGLAKEIDGVYQFKVTGSGGGEWVLDFRGGNFQICKGTCENPDCTFTSSDKNLIGIATGKLNPAIAFLTGKIQFTNLFFASKLKPLFTD